MRYDIEIFCENGLYCAYIAAKGEGECSSHNIICDTPQERADEIRDFFVGIEE